jgi:hypothetical protein
MKKTVAVALISGLACGAHAQTAPVTSALPSTPPPANTIAGPGSFAGYGSTGFANQRYFADVYQRVVEYGRCAANVAPERARSAVDAPPNTLDEQVKLNNLRISTSACLPYGYRPPRVFIRGGLAEALYKKQAVASGPVRTDLGALIAEESGRDRSRFGDDRMFTHAALCASARAPRAVDALLRSKPGSVDERVALSAVAQQAGGCLAGVSYLPGDGGPAYLRAYLAESALRVTSG